VVGVVVVAAASSLELDPEAALWLDSDPDAAEAMP
jgi:hypothetical protein